MEKRENHFGSPYLTWRNAPMNWSSAIAREITPHADLEKLIQNAHCCVNVNVSHPQKSVEFVDLVPSWKKIARHVHACKTSKKQAILKN